MNMDSAYNLKASLKIKPCIDSISLCSYRPLLLTRKPLRSILQIPGLPLLPLRVTSWPTTELNRRCSQHQRAQRCSIPWLLLNILAAINTAGPYPTCLKPLSPWDSRRPLLHLLSFTCRLLIFSRALQMMVTSSEILSLPIFSLLITFRGCPHTLTSAILCVYNFLNLLLQTILSSEWPTSKCMVSKSYM